MQNVDTVINESIDFINSFDSDKPIRIIARKNPDSVCASSIFIRLLTNLDRSFSVSFVKYINLGNATQLSYEKNTQYIFLDLGSKQDKLQNKKILFLDAGDLPCTLSTLTYHISIKLDPDLRSMSHIATIPLVGTDIEDMNEFNRDVIQDAVQNEKIRVSQGLKILDIQSRPISKILQLSVTPYINEVTGSEMGSQKFLQELGINPRKEKSWRMLSDLNEFEMKKLSEALISKTNCDYKSDDIIGNLYSIIEDEEISPTTYLNEFRTLLEACIRFNKIPLAIGTCLNDEVAKNDSIPILRKYRNELHNNLKWFKENKGTPSVIVEKGFIIVKAERNIKPSFSGIMCEILAKSGILEKNTLILILSHFAEEKTKISFRYGNSTLPINVKLDEILNNMIKELGQGESGGENHAAGAKIPQEREDKFINIARKNLAKIAMEEVII